MKTQKDASKLGLNRTGLGTSPVEAPRMIKSSHEGLAPSDPLLADGLHAERTAYSKEAGPLGSMPPPPTLKGMLKSAVQALKGERAHLFVDKLGERLAFERSGVRLYEAALQKFDAFGTWPGGPTRMQLVGIRDDELSHMQLVKASLLQLGVDPTVMTPSADLHANISAGLPKVLTDPRTTFRQGLEALLVAELADTAAWELLTELARELGQDALVPRFAAAGVREAQHVESVRTWLSAGLRAEVHVGAPEDAAQPSSP